MSLYYVTTQVQGIDVTEIEIIQFRVLSKCNHITQDIQRVLSFFYHQYYFYFH